MKVLLISLFIPSKHNEGGPSALTYYLAKERPSDIKIDLVYYNHRKETGGIYPADLSEIFSTIREVKRTPKIYYYFLKAMQVMNIRRDLKGLDLAYLPSARDLQAIQQSKYDLIWIYPNILYGWYEKLLGSKIVMTGPDCSFLFYQLIKEYSSKDPRLFSKDLYQIKKYDRLSVNSLALESRWANSKALLHVVGTDDKKIYDQLGGEDHSFFSSHPHSTYQEIDESIDETHGKLTILITGVNNSVATGSLGDKIIGLLTQNRSLSSRYRFLILGKGFDIVSEKLGNAGYEVEQHEWVVNYESTIKKAHIQIFPIVLGIGTKGKVLCALATGLLCIGTKHAFENILIDPEKDCILINDEKDIANILTNIYDNRARFGAMARTASEKVRIMHSPQSTAKLFWDHIKDHWANN
jgi:hypothetical protein